MRWIALIFLMVPLRLIGGDPPASPGEELSQMLVELAQVIGHDQKELPRDATPIAATNSTSAVAPDARGADADADAFSPRHTSRQQNHLLHAMAALRINVDRGDYTDAIVSAQSLAITDHSAPAQALLTRLIAKLFALRSAQEQLAAEDVRRVLDHATAVIAAAGDPKALDPVLTDIGAAMDRNRFGTFTSTHLALTSQLVDADRFVKDYQTYLFDKQSGDLATSIGDLDRLLAMGETFRPIPRSQLLEWRREAVDQLAHEHRQAVRNGQ